MNKKNSIKEKRKPKVKVIYRKFPGSNILVPLVNLGYKTDAVKDVREMRGHY